jgi:hypothetical protein
MPVINIVSCSVALALQLIEKAELVNSRLSLNLCIQTVTAHLFTNSGIYASYKDRFICSGFSPAIYRNDTCQ